MKVLLARETPSAARDKILLGKVFLLNQEELVFCHESHRESWYRDLNCPYGIDTDVLDWIVPMQVVTVHHYVRETERLYMASVEDIRKFGVGHIVPGEGERLYLPAQFWDVQVGRDYQCPFTNNNKVFSWRGDGADIDDRRWSSVPMSTLTESPFADLEPAMIFIESGSGVAAAEQDARGEASVAAALGCRTGNGS